MSRDIVKRAVESAGGFDALAARLGITRQAIGQWKKIPPVRVLDVSRASGIPPHELRPDLYPEPTGSEAA